MKLQRFFLAIFAIACVVSILIIPLSGESKDPPGSRTFDLRGQGLDICFSEDLCSTSAEIYFCKQRGYNRPLSSKSSISPSTRQLLSGKTCPIGQNCIQFDSITCVNECDFSSVPGIEKCDGAVGNQCEGGVPSPYNYVNPSYTYGSVCIAKAFVTPGSQAHDKCCQKNFNIGYACKGWTFGEPVKSPPFYDIPCEKEWRGARNDVISGNGKWKDFGPYYRVKSGQ
jgi:hypothetical protein